MAYEAIIDDAALEHDFIDLKEARSRRTRRDGSTLQTPLETYLREINETALLSAEDLPIFG